MRSTLQQSRLLPNIRHGVLIAFVITFPFGLAAKIYGAEAIAPSPLHGAAELNRLLNGELGSATAESQPAAIVSDETYVRRVYLDIVGEPPTPTEVNRFVIDASSNKRVELVDRLLSDRRFGENWGRYWRDVIMYRRTEMRAADLAGNATRTYIAEFLNANKPWSELATSLITAKGSVKENGATAIFAAQGGMPEDVASEVSRIFLGIQIQCAQCHDHPTDRWKRKEFHELAAFFPRVALRPDRSSSNFDFVVSVTDFEPRFRPRNNDNRFFGTLEHHMPDLENPSSKGTLTQPAFFVSGAQAKPGLNDLSRRTQLASWIVSPTNSWFAKAFVNRIWSELVGEGFYEPVDDIGPDRDCSAPKSLELLASDFARTGFDVKSVFRAITATETYQRESRSRRVPNESPFLANCPQRLRADQLVAALAIALDISLDFLDRPANRGQLGPIQQRLNSPRGKFNQEFGYDPSERRDEISNSIPQALFLMNSPLLNQAMIAPRSGLNRLLTETREDHAALYDLYLRALSREPTDREVSICLGYIQEVGDRKEAFQDILWSLMNSTEFLYRK